MDSRLVCSNRPLPHAPCTFVADRIAAPRSADPDMPDEPPGLLPAADCAADPATPAADPAPPDISDSAEAGSTATVSQSRPITLGLAGAFRVEGAWPDQPFGRSVAVFTLAPG